MTVMGAGDDREKSESPEDMQDRNPALTLLSPSGYVPDRRFLASGRDAAPRGHAVQIYESGSERSLGASQDINEDGSWTVSALMPSDADLTYWAGQVGRGPSTQKKIVRRPTTLTQPSSDHALDPDQVVFGGECYPGERPTDPGMRIRVLEGTTELASVTAVGPGTTWQARPTLPLVGKRYTVRAEYAVESSPILSYTNDLTFEVIDLLIITAPTADQEMNFTVHGTGGSPGAKIEVKLDVAGTLVGEGVVGTNRTWTASVRVSPGPVSLVAEQIYQGVPSTPSAAQLFRVRPPRLTAVTVTQPISTSVKFEGAGHTGAMVQVSVVSGPGGVAPPAVSVVAERWTTTATNWPYGAYSLKVVQSVPDNADGWIESLPYTFPVNLVVPDPTDITYTPDYRPAFSGKGLTGATVKLFNSGGGSTVAPDAPVMSNGGWTTTASEVWGPTFKREVHIKQYANGQASAQWIRLEVTIPPLAPVMNAPVENGLSPNLSGTCWPGAELKLKFSDSAIEHPVTNDNGTWRFRRDEPFAPDSTHTATMTQTAAQQTSPAASITFMVALPMRPPVITYPDAAAEVGRTVTIRGRDGMAGATLQLRDAQFDRPLGEPNLLDADGDWAIELSALEFRQYTLDAQQTLAGRPSERSDIRTFTVVLLPPEFEVPQPGGDLPRISELSGTGMPGGKVEVWLQGESEPLEDDIFVDSDGCWKADVSLPVGVTRIQARQHFEGQTSRDSPVLTYNVVPAAPFIETPTTDEAIGRRVVVSGFGVPGDTVTVKLGDAALTVLGSNPVLEDRTWSVTVTFDQPGGVFGLMAVASSEGFDSADSPPRVVVLGTYQPSIDVPEPGRWTANPVRFEGQGRPGVGQVVSWFNPERVWAPDLAVAAGGWQGGAAQPLSAGGNWCRFKQTLSDAADGATVSDWVESKRFEILPSSTQS